MERNELFDLLKIKISSGHLDKKKIRKNRKKYVKCGKYSVKSVKFEISNGFLEWNW